MSKKKKIRKRFKRMSKNKRDIELKNLEAEYNTESIINFLELELKKDKKKVSSHSKYVVYLAIEILKQKKIDLTKLEKEIVIYGALLHDIGKYKTKGRKHADEGVNIVNNQSDDKVFEKVQSIIPQILTVIDFHNRTIQLSKDNIEDDKLRLIAKAVHDADKISKIHKKRTWVKKEKYFEKEKYFKKKKMIRTVESIRKKLVIRESEKVLDKCIEPLNW